MLVQGYKDYLKEVYKNQEETIAEPQKKLYKLGFDNAVSISTLFVETMEEAMDEDKVKEKLGCDCSCYNPLSSLKVTKFTPVQLAELIANLHSMYEAHSIEDLVECLRISKLDELEVTVKSIDINGEVFTKTDINLK